jgi:hypothetical protein
MATKTLLFTDHEAQANWQADIDDTRKRANELIFTFEKYQPWQKIDTLGDFYDLISDPLKLFDEVLLQNVNVSAVGKAANPSVVADIFNIDRTGFAEKVKKAIRLQVFERYDDFLTFQNRGFILKDTAIKAEAERFKVYITTPEQQAVYDHWKGLCDLLNAHAQRGYVGPAKLSEFALACGFRWVPDLHEVCLDDLKVRTEIFKTIS